MNIKQARNLLPQTVVMWKNNSADPGTVRKIGSWGLYIDWKNGKGEWIAFEDCKYLSIWQPADQQLTESLP